MVYVSVNNQEGRERVTWIRGGHAGKSCDAAAEKVPRELRPAEPASSKIPLRSVPNSCPTAHLPQQENIIQE